VNSDPAAQLRLLDLQAADTALAQLAHRRRTLPEIAAVAAATKSADDLQTEIVDAETRVNDLAGDQRKLENEVDTVRTRASRDEQRLTTGGLPSKELESLQHEVISLARRQSTLEDDLLEIMEEREGVEGGLADLIRHRNEIIAERSRLESERDAQFAGIDEQSAARARERAAVAAELPADLLALYDKVAAANGGVGAARLHQRRCEGCHLELAGNELTSVRNAEPETIVRCENCRRILIRTAESGL
jgi:predicted  nucleic acid-binding Zn-ribbon protein